MKTLLLLSAFTISSLQSEELPKTQLINIHVICPECNQLSYGYFIFDSKEPIYNTSIQMHKIEPIK